MEKLLLTPPLLVRAVSPSNLAGLFNPGITTYTSIDLIVLGCAVLTGALLVMAPSLPLVAKLGAAVYATWRIVDTVAYQLAVVLVDSQRPEWKLASVRRSFLLALINLAEMVCAFALLYLTVGHVVSTRTGSDAPSIVSPIQALGFSVGYMVTAGGGEFVAGNDSTRRLLVFSTRSPGALRSGHPPVRREQPRRGARTSRDGLWTGDFSSP